MIAVCPATVYTGDLLAPFDSESEGRNAQGCRAMPVVCWPAPRVLYEAIRSEHICRICYYTVLCNDFLSYL